MIKIGIHGVPRSGTTWLGAIFDSSLNVAYRNQPLFSYAFKSYLSENSSKMDIDNFFQGILKTNDDYILQKEGKRKGFIPIFKKEFITHIIYKEARYHNVLLNLLGKDPDVKVIGIIRNPKSVISSWYFAPKEFNKLEWSLFEEWKYANLKNKGLKEEFYGFNKWKEVAELFLKLMKDYPDRFYLINYSELLTQTEKIIKDTFGFCKLEYLEQTKEFIDSSKKFDLSEDAYSVYRKNQVDDKWKESLPSEISNEIDFDLAGTILEQFNK